MSCLQGLVLPLWEGVWCDCIFSRVTWPKTNHTIATVTNDAHIRRCAHRDSLCAHRSDVLNTFRSIHSCYQHTSLSSSVVTSFVIAEKAVRKLTVRRRVNILQVSSRDVDVITLITSIHLGATTEHRCMYICTSLYMDHIYQCCGSHGNHPPMVSWDCHSPALIHRLDTFRTSQCMWMWMELDYTGQQQRPIRHLKGTLYKCVRLSDCLQADRQHTPVNFH